MRGGPFAFAYGSLFASRFGTAHEAEARRYNP